MTMTVPQKYQLKPHEIEAALFDGDSAAMMDVYKWVEGETQGSFDPFNVAASGSGVSIDPGTGQMMIATLNGVLYVKKGEWVVKTGDGQFSKYTNDPFQLQFETVDGSPMPQPTPPPAEEVPEDVSTDVPGTAPEPTTEEATDGTV
jgi:hypothetical protein